MGARARVISAARCVAKVTRARACLYVARAGEVFAELVEGDGHHAVRRVEGFLDAVAVVDVDVDVQHAGDAWNETHKRLDDFARSTRAPPRIARARRT